MSPDRSLIPNPFDVATIDLSRGSGSDYAWRVVSDCGVVKVYSTRDGCLFALNSYAARQLARDLAEALNTAADATDVRGYGYVVDRFGRRVPEGGDPLEARTCDCENPDLIEWVDRNGVERCDQCDLPTGAPS